jgi:hypothetical protein
MMSDTVLFSEATNRVKPLARRTTESSETAYQQQTTTKKTWESGTAHVKPEAESYGTVLFGNQKQW